MNCAMWAVGIVGGLMIAVPLVFLHKPNNARFELYFTKGAYAAIWGGIFLLCSITLFLIARDLITAFKH